MKASRGNPRSLRGPMLFAAVAGLALSASGCFIGSSSQPIDTDGDGIDDAFDDCPLLPEDVNGVLDFDGCPDSTTCTPDLNVFWEIRSALSASAPLRTCQQAGNADTVTAWIDGGGLGSVLTAFDVPCPASASSGSFIAQLPSSGSYNVSLELTAGTTLLSETPILVAPVDCTGTSVTPVADLRVNF